MTIRRFFPALAVLATPCLAADYSLQLTPENTKIQWTLGGVLHTVKGKFELTRGSIDFNTETGTASGSVAVNLASGKSGDEARDRRMHSDVLQSDKYPEATFVPSRVVGTIMVPGSSVVRVIGTFTIHGASHEIAMDVRTKAAADHLEATITFEIPYVAWGMKDPSNFLLRVDKKVKVTINTAGVLKGSGAAP